MNYQLSISFLFIVLFVSVVSELQAQDFNEELRRQLREEMVRPNIQPQHQQLPSQMRPHRQEQPEVLRVSPTTRLPTRFDRIQTLRTPEELVPTINFDALREVRSQVDESVVDYSTGTFNPPLDPRSIAQFAQGGIGADRILGGSGVVIDGLDFDPVRAIQARQHRRRQARLDALQIPRLQSRFNIVEMDEITERVNEILREMKKNE